MKKLLSYALILSVFVAPIAYQLMAGSGRG